MRTITITLILALILIGIVTADAILIGGDKPTPVQTISLDSGKQTEMNNLGITDIQRSAIKCGDAKCSYYYLSFIGHGTDENIGRIVTTSAYYNKTIGDKEISNIKDAGTIEKELNDLTEASIKSELDRVSTVTQNKKGSAGSIGVAK